MNIVILISGNGSNLQAIIDYFCHHDSITIKAVISNRADAYGLVRARRANITAHCIDHTTFHSRQAFERALITTISEFTPDLLVLAGFMRKLSPVFINCFRNKIINIHPSLLPKYKGLNTHEKVIKNGDLVHGITIHSVNESLDGGPIISQSSINITSNETIADLKQRIQTLEHWCYPRIIELISNHTITFVEDNVFYQGKALSKTGIMLKK